MLFIHNTGKLYPLQLFKVLMTILDVNLKHLYETISFFLQNLSVDI